MRNREGRLAERQRSHRLGGYVPRFVIGILQAGEVAVATVKIEIESPMRLDVEATCRLHDGLIEGKTGHEWFWRESLRKQGMTRDRIRKQTQGQRWWQLWEQK